MSVAADRTDTISDLLGRLRDIGVTVRRSGEYTAQIAVATEIADVEDKLTAAAGHLSTAAAYIDKARDTVDLAWQAHLQSDIEEQQKRETDPRGLKSEPLGKDD